MKNKISELILENELLWLESIGCEIKNSLYGVSVTHSQKCTTDFNFFVPREGFKDFKEGEKTCYRISDRNFDVNKFLQLLKGYSIDKCYDINLVYNPIVYQPDTINILEVNIERWNSNDPRKCSENSHYYNVYESDTYIGKFSTIEGQNILGIYDLEVHKVFRGNGFGQKLLRQFCYAKNKIIYIQTWIENIDALKCYQLTGFRNYELLYRVFK